MLKKIGLLSLACVFLQSCQQFLFVEDEIKAPVPEVAFQQPTIKLPNSIIVCRNKQCAPARLSMSKEYIYNTLLHMFDSNARKKALICAADPNTHSCTEEYVSMPITVGITPAYLYIDDVKITDVAISRRNTSALNLVLNWNITYNGQTPICRPSKTLLYTKNINNVIMEDNGYTCKMTTIGTSTIKTLFAVDYIDLDYGFIGGFYSIGISGPAFGGGSGYMILRLPEDISVSSKDFKATMKKFAEEVEVEVKVEVTEETEKDSSTENEKDKKVTASKNAKSVAKNVSSDTNKADKSAFFRAPKNNTYVPPVSQLENKASVQKSLTQKPTNVKQPVSVQQPVKKVVKKRRVAPNVDTIIKYNHPAKAYENAKLDVLKTREERKKALEEKRKAELEKKKREAQAMEYDGIKVYPIKHTPKAVVAPKDKNALTEYQPRPEVF